MQTSPTNFKKSRGVPFRALVFLGLLLRWFCVLFVLLLGLFGLFGLLTPPRGVLVVLALFFDTEEDPFPAAAIAAADTDDTLKLQTR